MKFNSFVYCLGTRQPSHFASAAIINILSSKFWLIGLTLIFCILSLPALAEEKSFWEKTTIGKFLSGKKENPSSNTTTITSGASYTIDPTTKRFAIYSVNGKSLRFNFPKGLCANVDNPMLTPQIQKKLDQKSRESGLEAGLTLRQCQGEKVKNTKLVNASFFYQKPSFIMASVLKTAQNNLQLKKRLIEDFRKDQHAQYQNELDKMWSGAFGKSLLDNLKKQTGQTTSYTVTAIKKLPVHDNGFYTGAKQTIIVGSHKFTSYLVMSNLFKDGEFYRLSISGHPNIPLNQLVHEAQNITNEILSQNSNSSNITNAQNRSDKTSKDKKVAALKQNKIYEPIQKTPAPSRIKNYPKHIKYQGEPSRTNAILNYHPDYPRKVQLEFSDRSLIIHKPDRYCIASYSPFIGTQKISPPNQRRPDVPREVLFIPCASLQNPKFTSLTVKYWHKATKFFVEGSGQYDGEASDNLKTALVNSVKSKKRTRRLRDSWTRNSGIRSNTSKKSEYADIVDLGSSKHSNYAGASLTVSTPSKTIKRYFIDSLSALNGKIIEVEIKCDFGISMQECLAILQNYTQKFLSQNNINDTNPSFATPETKQIQLANRSDSLSRLDRIKKLESQLQKEKAALKKDDKTVIKLQRFGKSFQAVIPEYMCRNKSLEAKNNSYILGIKTCHKPNGRNYVISHQKFADKGEATPPLGAAIRMLMSNNKPFRVNSPGKLKAVFKAAGKTVHKRRQKEGSKNQLERIKKSYKKAGQSHLVLNASLQSLDVIDKQPNKISIGKIVQVELKNHGPMAQHQIETFFVVKGYLFKYSAVYRVTSHLSSDPFLKHQNQMVDSFINLNKKSTTSALKPQSKKTSTPKKKLFRDNIFND